MEGAAYLRRKAPAIHLMLDESIHGPVDAARACRMDAADILNIKLMKCGGLYPAEQINAIAQANGLTCMVGCMMETKLSITAGLSFVAAKKNVMDADLDSFMEYVGGETHFPGASPTRAAILCCATHRVSGWTSTFDLPEKAVCGRSGTLVPGRTPGLFHFTEG